MKKRKDKLRGEEKIRMYFVNMRSCIEKKKQPFKKRKQAIEACERRMREVPGLVLEVYRCAYCGNWHKTSKITRSKT